MNGTVNQWLDKAERDFHTASRELEASANPNYDAVCFHAQQCVEKLMKGLLIKFGVTPPRTHGLIALSNLLTSECREWTASSDDLRFLSRAAVDFRYPGETADRETAGEALLICTSLRERLLSLYHS